MTTRALSLIEDIALARSRLRADARGFAALDRLQRWQVARLQRTYADYYRRDRYRAGLDFFMQDLYGPHDFSGRDRDLRKVMSTWYRVLPERGLAAIVQALELELLSLELDMQMVHALADRALTESSYANAYRATDRRADRQRQISFIISAGSSLDELIGHKWIAPALRLARRPARLAGLSELQVFLERGYAAFAKMGGADELLRVIEAREAAISQNLFAGAPNPFDVTDVDRGTRRKVQ